MQNSDSLNREPEQPGTNTLQYVLNRVKQDIVRKLAPFVSELEKYGGLVLVTIDGRGTSATFKYLPEELCRQLQLAVQE